MRNAQNLPRHELIGLPAVVVHSSDRKQMGMKGKIVDETKNMLVFERDDGKEMKIAKIGRRFAFEVEGKTVELDGNKIAFDPVERVKKCVKKS